MSTRLILKKLSKSLKNTLLSKKADTIIDSALDTTKIDVEELESILTKKDLPGAALEDISLE